MFKSLWQCLLKSAKSGNTTGRRSQSRQNRVRLQFDRLEDRVTPSGVDVTAVVHGTTLFVTEKSSVGVNGGGGIQISNPSAGLPGVVAVQTPQGVSINGQLAQSGSGFFETPTQDLGNGRIAAKVAITAISIQLGNGTDKITAGATLTGALTISGTGGDKTINVGGSAASVSINLLGNGMETTTLDANVAGAVTINHPGTGDTSLTTARSSNSAYTMGSLTVTNGPGFDTNAIGDTDFLGNVTINNGAGGSFTNISATSDQNLTNIGGNLTINTTSGPSQSELYDYNVHGNVNINTGTGAAGQKNFVGLENIQSFSTSGVPVINGNVNITGSTTAGSVLDVVAGTDIGDPQVNNGMGAAADLPLTILGNLTISATGPAKTPAPVFVDLNDLNVPNGTTAITLGAGTMANTVMVQAGTSLTSVYNNFTATFNSSGGSGLSIQDQGGTTVFHGTVNVQFNTGNSSTVFLAADAGSDAGVGSNGGPVGFVTFWGKTTFKAKVKPSGQTGNKFYGRANNNQTFNNNILFAQTPTTTNFLLV
jgi:hypothetical protein